MRAHRLDSCSLGVDGLSWQWCCTFEELVLIRLCARTRHTEAFAHRGVKARTCQALLFWATYLHVAIFLKSLCTRSREV